MLMVEGSRLCGASGAGSRRIPTGRSSRWAVQTRSAAASVGIAGCKTRLPGGARTSNKVLPSPTACMRNDLAPAAFRRFRDPADCVPRRNHRCSPARWCREHQPSTAIGDRRGGFTAHDRIVDRCPGGDLAGVVEVGKNGDGPVEGPVAGPTGWRSSRRRWPSARCSHATTSNAEQATMMAYRRRPVSAWRWQCPRSPNVSGPTTSSQAVMTSRQHRPGSVLISRPRIGMPSITA